MGLPNGKKKMNTLYCVAQSDLSLRMQVYSESPMKETSYTLSKARLVRKLKMRSKGRKLSFRLILSGYGQNDPEAQRMATETSPQPAITSYTRIINPVLQYDVDMD
jgi:hypothetical protein